MSTLVEIEAAVDTLPLDEQQELLEYLAAKLSVRSQPRKRSMHELIKNGCDIVGSGLPDLGSNKEHLREFGR